MNPVFQKSPWKKSAQKKNHQIRNKASVELEILSGVIVVNANQRLLMQKAFTAWIKKKTSKVISKVEIFIKYYVICKEQVKKTSIVIGFCLLGVISSRITFLLILLCWYIFNMETTMLTFRNCNKKTEYLSNYFEKINSYSSSKRLTSFFDSEHAFYSYFHVILPFRSNVMFKKVLMMFIWPASTDGVPKNSHSEKYLSLQVFR